MDLHLFGTGTAANSPGQFFLLGTNQSGQDLFSQILVGGRTSLVLSAIVILSSFLLGVALGGISGYWGGWVDTALQRLGGGGEGVAPPALFVGGVAPGP